MHVGFVDGDCVGEFSGGVDVAEEDVNYGVSGFLAGVVCEEDGGDVGVLSEGESVDSG